MLSKMILSKQMKTLTQQEPGKRSSLIVQKQLGGEGGPGLLGHHGLPLQLLGQDDHHLQEPVHQGGLEGGGTAHHQEEFQNCLWFFRRRAPR